MDRKHLIHAFEDIQPDRSKHFMPEEIKADTCPMVSCSNEQSSDVTGLIANHTTKRNAHIKRAPATNLEGKVIGCAGKI